MDGFRTPRGWREKVDVTILKVIEPNRFMIREAASIHMSDCGRAFMTMERKLRHYMEKYDIEPFDSTPPARGAEIICRTSAASQWYRAVVNRVLDTLEGYKIEVTLIDYGETVYVERKYIRSPQPHVFDVPGQSVEFFLPYLKPATLALNEMAVAEFRPAKRWDTAALEYMRTLISKGGAAVVHVLGSTKAGRLYGKLIIRTDKETVYVNEDLVIQKYAFLDKTMQVDEDTETQASPASLSTPSMPLESPQLVLMRARNKRQQEEAMRAMMEQALYGTVSPYGSRAATPITSSVNCSNSMSRGARNNSQTKRTSPNKLPLHRETSTNQSKATVHSSPNSTATPFTSPVNYTASMSREARNKPHSQQSTPDCQELPSLPETSTDPSKAPVCSSPNSVPVSTGWCSPSPSFASKDELLFSDVETSSVASMNPVPTPPGRGRASLLLSGWKRAGNQGAVTRAVVRPGDFRADGQEGVACLLDVPSSPVTQEQGGARSGGQVHPSSVGSVRPVGSASGTEVPRPLTLPKYGGTNLKAVGGSSSSLKPPEISVLHDTVVPLESNTASDIVHGQCPSPSGSVKNSSTSPVAKLSLLLSKRRTPEPYGATSTYHTPAQQRSDREGSSTSASELSSSKHAADQEQDHHQSKDTLDSSKASLSSTKLDNLLRKEQPSLNRKDFASVASSDIQSSLHLHGKQSNMPFAQKVSEMEAAGSREADMNAAQGSKSLKLEKLKKLLGKGTDNTPVRTVSSCSSASSISPAATVQAQGDTPEPHVPRPSSTLIQKLRSVSKSKSTNSSEESSSNVSTKEPVLQFCPAQKMDAMLSVPADKAAPELRMTVNERLHRLAHAYGHCYIQGGKMSQTSDGDQDVRNTTAGEEHKEEDKMEEIYRTFIKGYPANDDESEPEGEEKWELKFPARCNHQELVDLNICEDSDDFRCHDFNNFSDLPPDLEPYTQFEGEVNFSTYLEPSDWAARIERKHVHALVHGVAPPRPVFTLEEAHFAESLRMHVTGLGFRRPSCIQSVVWPAVLSGRSIIEVAARHAGKTLSYLMPLLSRVSSESDYSDLPVSSGPLVLVLCSTWKGAQRVFDELMLLVQDHRVPKCCVLYAGGSEAGKEVQLVNGCDFLVATPLSFLRTFRTYRGLTTNLKRCCHLVLDDGERLVEEFTQEVGHILAEFSSCFQERVSRCGLNQVIVCSTRWTLGLRSLLHLLREQQSPLVFFSSFFEAAVYSQVPTFAHYIDHRAKNQTLLELVEGCRGKKTVICTSSYESALFIHKLLMSWSIYALLLHDRLSMPQIWDVENAWASHHNVHSVPILVSMDNVLSWGNVRDAAAVIHYDVPELSKINFGFRFACLADRMQSFDKMGTEEVDVRNRPVSHLLLTAEDQPISVGLVDLLKRLGSKIPSGLLQLADKELKRRLLDEDFPLCPKLKAFGHCEALEVGKLSHCRNRHRLIAALDSPNPSSFIPSCSEVKILITTLVDASHFYGLILAHWEPSEDGSTGKRVEHKELFELAMGMGRHFCKPHSRVALEDSVVPVIGGIYALETKQDIIHRVKVTSIINEKATTGEPLRVEVLHIDHGHRSKISAHCLLHLPEEFAMHPPYAVEVYCCRIQPQDRDSDWTFQADFAAYNLVAEKELQGKVALHMGNTLWLDPLVLCKHLGNVEVSVINTHVRNSLISAGMACDNPKHLIRLRQAAERAGIPVPNLKGIVHVPTEDEPDVQHPPCAFLEHGVYNNVSLWKVYSPHHFYVQTEKFASCLERLEDDIAKHVAEKILQSPKKLRHGVLCLAPFTNDRFYRGQVENVSSDGSVTVFFPDYGDTVECPQEEIYCVEPWMLLLPFQGIECTLAGVGPLEGEWQPEAGCALEDMGYTVTNHNKPLLAKVLNHTKSSRSAVRCYEIVLYDATGRQDINLADELVRRGLATATEISVPDMDLSNSAAMAPSAWMETTQSASQEPHNCSGSDDFDLVDELCAEAMTEHMDNLYGEMREDILKQHAAGPSFESCATARPPSHQNTCSKEKKSASVEAVIVPPPPLDFCQRSLQSIRPSMNWWQDKSHVYVEILLTMVKAFDFMVKSRLLIFRTKVNGRKYEVYEGLYARVVASSCSAEARPGSVKVTLKKSKPGLKWQDLTNRGYKVNYIRYNLSRIVDSDDEAVDQKRSPYPLGYVKPTDILPYDPVAHEDDVLEKESQQGHINAPIEDMFDDPDPNDPFS